MDSNKKKFLDICKFENKGELYNSVLFNVFWKETLQNWVDQGADESILDHSSFGIFSDGLQKKFSLDPMFVLIEVCSGLGYWWVKDGDPGVPVMPGFKKKIIEENNETITYLGATGKILKVLKSEPEGMPTYVDYPVKDRSTWKEFKKRLDPSSPERMPPNWSEYIEKVKLLDCPIDLEIGGYFGYLAQMMGIENLIYAYYDDPFLIEDMMDTIYYLESEMLKKVASEIQLSMVTMWEDMAYKSGPMISPDIFKKFMMPRYKKMVNLVNSLGIDVVHWDSDGNIELIIPLLIECGVNLLWPLEVAAGMDAVKLRKIYGNDIVLAGNIDKRELSKGKSEIKNEVMKKVPFLLNKGGYFPSLDHMVPPDVPLENWCYYINLIRDIAGLDMLHF